MMSKKKSTLSAKINRLIHFLEHDVWKLSLEELPGRKSYLIRQLRVILLAVRGFNEDNVGMRASALTYFTLLSIVPVVGLLFGIAKGFGMETYLEQQLNQTFAGREEVLEWVMTFAQSMLETARGGVVAGIGLVILLYTILNLLYNMEASFNQIWQINKARPWSRKFSDFFSIMFLAPLFFILSSAVTIFLSTIVTDISGSLEFLSFLSSGLLFLVNMIPYILVWVMLTLLYMIMPFTNVKFTSALVAGIIAGTLFQLVQWGYIFFQIGASRYNAIYGSFAALPLLLIWVQVSWLVILFGAEISYALQNVDHYEFDIESRNISPYNKKLLSLYVMHLLVRNFIVGEKPWNAGQIAFMLIIPNKLTHSILNDLVNAGLVTETRVSQDKELSYQPALDVNQISIRMVLDRMDHLGDDVMVAKPTPRLNALEDSLKAFNNTIGQSDKNILLKDLK